MLHGDHPCGFHTLTNSVQTIKHFGSEILLYYLPFWFHTSSLQFSLVFASRHIYVFISGCWAMGCGTIPVSRQ